MPVRGHVGGVETRVAHRTNGAVGQRVVEGKVRVRDQIEEERHSVQLDFHWKRIGCSQHMVKVVCPQIVAHETENPDPNVGFHPIGRTCVPVGESPGF